jgi:hypothetical protein
MHRARLLTLFGVMAAAVLVFASPALATKAPRAGSAVDTFHIGPDVSGLPVIDSAPGVRQFRSAAAAPAAAQATAQQVGEVRNWLALDDTYGFYYRKAYTLRAVGQHIEVWVASELNRRAPATTALPQVGQSSGTNFLDGDCRNGPRTVITDDDVNDLVRQFDTNIYPKESAVFSVPPNRDGANTVLPPATYNPAGEGDNIVALIDNVRDDNFYDFNNTNNFSYIAGFFSSQLNNFFDRNVMTIDAFDWLHRTGATPPHEPVPGNNCTSAPARPFLYEGTFAHEYQHLLEHYEDADEVSWVNEGLSDWAETLTGYANPSLPITKTGFDSHTQCFLGWLGVETPANPNPRPTGGPENSLTLWGDQGDDEILCDYGAAYTLMGFLDSRFGHDFMTQLHREDANGLAGLQNVLNGVSRKLDAQQLLHEWSLMVAIDGLIDDGGRVTGHVNDRDVSSNELHGTINWDTPEAYSERGAPPNGADYVRLRDAGGNYLNGGNINSLSFAGSTTLPTQPVQWTVDANPPFHTGNPALYSGVGNNRDEAIVHEVAVPTGAGAQLTFNALWNEEAGWDFGFVQVSTDGGSTYQSVACTDTTTVTAAGALPTAKENVPGFTGYSGGWKPETCSLSTYAGQTVLLAFRTFNDPNTGGPEPSVPTGFWVDDVTLGGTVLSDGSLFAGWRSFTQVKPNTVAGFTVRIVSIRTDKNQIRVRELPLNAAFTLTGRANVRKYIDPQADFVGAIVFYDDPSETSLQYAPYRLTVNGVVQPGGGL